MSTRLAVRLTLALALSGAACGESSNAPARGGPFDQEGVDAGARAAVDSGADSGAEAGTRSVGCGVAPQQLVAQYIKHTEVVTGVSPAYAADYTNRFYWLRLPAGYDPDRAYPTVFIGPGCGESGQTPIPIQAASGSDAILVGLNGFEDCFTHDTADTPELPYFDATLAAVEASACVDTSRVFVMGFSSGAWLTSYLGCARGNVLRGQASIGGGLPPLPPTCTGPIPAMYVTDTDDNKNPPASVMMALARVLATNGCGADTEPYEAGVPSPCVQYKGCTPGFPVVFCQTSGIGHADQSTTTKISTVGFWHFWSSLP
jgi:polyhydroxybutyrate depolymerase